MQRIFATTACGFAVAVPFVFLTTSATAVPFDRFTDCSYCRVLANGVSDQEISSSLEAAFADIGYPELTVNRCEIAFFTDTEPNAENNYYFGLWRYLDLNSLRDFSQAAMEVYEAQGVTYYLMSIKFDDDYIERYRAYLAFDRFVRAEFPDANWPYDGPRKHDEFASRIEFEMQRRVTGLSALNRHVSFSQFGAVTYVEGSQVTFAADTPEKIERLTGELHEHSSQFGCDLEN